MPAHLKSALLGCSVTIPVREGRLALGTWQGLYLGEHRSDGGRRTVVATLSGEGGGAVPHARERADGRRQTAGDRSRRSRRIGSGASRGVCGSDRRGRRLLGQG